MYFDTLCYEADINVDMILSYPWMRENKVGIFPHHKALVVDEPRLMLLYGIHFLPDKKICENGERECLATRLDGYEGLKYSLTLPTDGLDVIEESLTNGELEGVLDRFCNIIEAKDPEGPEDPRVAELREKIFMEYEGYVFRDKVFPDPPERGQFEYAYIHLKGIAT